jgi:hypothetical protein
MVSPLPDGGGLFYYSTLTNPGHRAPQSIALCAAAAKQSVVTL